jgi:hypothetical protein
MGTPTNPGDDKENQRPGAGEEYFKRWVGAGGRIEFDFSHVGGMKVWRNLRLFKLIGIWNIQLSSLRLSVGKTHDISMSCIFAKRLLIFCIKTNRMQAIEIFQIS